VTVVAVALGIAMAAVAVIVIAGRGVTQAAGMQAMSVDSDIAGNTETSLGQNDPCVEATQGSDVVIDITALNIPASNPMIAYGYTLGYDPSVLSVTAQDINGLLSTAAGFSPLNASDNKPDTDGHFTASVVDINASGVSGSGRLDRLTLHVDSGAPDGQYTILLTNAAHIDTGNSEWPPDAINFGAIAVGQSCGPIVTPTPSPSPTPPPTPSPSPRPTTVTVGSATVAPGASTTVNLTLTPAQGVAVGAMDFGVLSGSEVTATDCTALAGVCSIAPNTATFALATGGPLSGLLGTITYRAGANEGSPDLTVTSLRCFDLGGQTISCLGVDATITIVKPSHYPGDVDCSSSISSVDALKVLRFTAGLIVNVPPDCTFNGNVDCDSDTDSVDALRILRYVAGLWNNLPASCPPIGPNPAPSPTPSPTPTPVPYSITPTPFHIPTPTPHG